ncbi:MAG: acetate--CoA ligase family protein, partial [Halobacteriota archaeon]
MTDPIEAARAAGRETVPEAQAKALLADVGISVPEYAVCSTPAEAVEAAEAIGYPVVVKVSSPSIA